MFIYVQVILRWALERGLSVVTKSANSERIAQNLDLFSFKLSDQDIKYAWRGVMLNIHDLSRTSSPVVQSRRRPLLGPSPG